MSDVKLVATYPNQCCSGSCVDEIGVHNQHYTTADYIAKEVQRLLAEAEAAGARKVAEAVEAAMRLLGTDHITPTGKRQIRAVLSADMAPIKPRPDWSDCGQSPCITCDPRRAALSGAIEGREDGE